MTQPAAFRATYADWKLVKTRQVVQVVFEVPLADHDAAYDVLGGMPNPAKETWFGIAPLKSGKEAMPNSRTESVPTRLDNEQPQPDNPRSAGAKRDWRDIPPAQQAGIRCEEPSFSAFLRENYSEDWREARQDAAECVRLICAVVSRSQLADGAARVIWHQLDVAYAAWKALEHA